MHSEAYDANWQRRVIQKAMPHQLIAAEAGVKDFVIKERSGKQIILVDGTVLTEFISCSYLGLETDPRLIDAVCSTAQKWGIQLACARTRIRTAQFDQLESLLREIFGGYHCVTFGSVTLTHLGLLPLLASGELPSYPIATNGPFFLLDKRAHASIQSQRGLLQQFGPVERVVVENMEYLETRFRAAVSAGRTPLYLGDGVGSMDGVAPVVDLVDLAEKYSGYLYLDDAHGTSIMGQHGCGYVLDSIGSVKHPRVVLQESLSKAFGTAGGVACVWSEDDALFLKRFATSYIFSGPLPLPMVNASIVSSRIHLDQAIHELQDRLWTNVRYIDELLGPQVVNFRRRSAIRGIRLGSEYQAISAARHLKEHGFATTLAIHPTIPLGESMIRIAIAAGHRQQEIQGLCEQLQVVLKRSSTIVGQK